MSNDEYQQQQFFTVKENWIDYMLFKFMEEFKIKLEEDYSKSFKYDTGEQQYNKQEF